MAPINLPDGSQVSEIVLPDGSTASEVLAPDGSTVFGNAIPDSVVFYPDSGDLTNFSGSTGDYDITSVSPTSAETGLSLKSQANGGLLFSDTGLASYPTRGDRFSIRVQIDANDNDVARVGFNAKSDSDYFFVQLQGDTNELTINSEGTVLVSTSYGVPSGEALTLVVEWQSDDTILFEVYREGDDPETTTPDESVSGQITPNTTSGSLDTGIIIQCFNRDSDASDLALFDYWIRERNVV